MRAHPTHVPGAARRLVPAALVSALLATPAGAQAPAVDPRWHAWLGCWTPSAAEGAAGTREAPLTCVLPTESASVVELVTVVDGRETGRQRLDASGTRRQRTDEGCTGWERAAWSADGRRLYTTAESSCEGGATRRSTGVLAITPNGEWSDVRSVQLGTGSGVRVLRFRDAGAVSVPTAVASALPTRLRDAALDARAVAGAAIGSDVVVDAVKHVDAAAVEGWLMQQGQGFGLDARKLTALADAGVPGRVVDVMVALSYPKRFALNPNTREAEQRPAEQGGRTSAIGRPGPSVMMDRYWYDPFGFNPYGLYGYNAYSPYGMRGLGGFGSGWFPGRSPVVVVVRNADGSLPSADNPRVVNGRGYTRGRATQDPSVSRAPSSAGSMEAGSSSGGSSSAGSSSSGSSSSGSSSSGSSSSGGRTAKPRP